MKQKEITRGKLIVIEGTDCSGKETQSKKLVESLDNAIYYTFPNYDSPTGKIVGGPFLGKKEICESFFPEKSPNVDAKVSSLYFAADRYYNIPFIEESLNNGQDVILDRYTYSNMAHQGCKIDNFVDRRELFYFIDSLEFGLLHLPRPDAVFFLHMPFEAAEKLKANRESLDDNEKDKEYLRKSESTYLELASLYNFTVIDCTQEGIILSIDEIHEKVVNEYENVKTRTLKK